MLALLLVNYQRPLEEVDRYLAAHRAYLDRYYASGHFVFSGRRHPRTGGLSLCRADSREQIDRIIQDDPFYIHGIASYEIIEFSATKSLPEIAHLLGIETKQGS